MADCTHDCAACKSACGERKIAKVPLRAGSRVKKVIAVMSGKGGVGKSLVSSLLAAQMNKLGFTSALIDADLIGASVPTSFGVQKERVLGDGTGALIPVRTPSGIQIMSIGFMLESETAPVALRAAMVTGYLVQFWKDALWENVDFMFIDMPPGTGDIPLTVFQSIPVDGIVVVSTPQDLVRVIVEKSLKFAQLTGVPVLGLVENMSYAVCPDCGKEITLFGKGATEKIALEYGIPLLARIPISPDIAQNIDAGRVEDITGDFLGPIAAMIQ